MSSPCEPPVTDDRAVPEESGLRCEHCDYNLTGLTIDRCPECGEAVYRARLLRVLAGRRESIPGWDDGSVEHVLARFLRVCLTTWMQPSLFARRFPWRCSRQSVRQFRLLSRSMAVVLLIVAVPIARIFVRPVQRVLSATTLVEAVLGMLVAATVCEMVLRRLFRAFLRPRTAPDRELPASAASWRGFVAFHSSFLVISAGTLGLIGNAAVAADGMKARTLVRCFVSACVLNLGWWWYCLGTGLTVRAMPTAGRWCVTLLIPAVAVGSVVIGILAALLSHLLLMPVFD